MAVFYGRVHGHTRCQYQSAALDVALDVAHNAAFRAALAGAWVRRAARVHGTAYAPRSNIASPNARHSGAQSCVSICAGTAATRLAYPLLLIVPRRARCLGGPRHRITFACLC
ncbi:protein of unknown function [Paraburkholderia kururiensis]